MRSWLGCVVALAAGCYQPPKPACGFVCGPQGACPTSYTCFPRDNRCHRDGTDGPCEALADGSLDGFDTTRPQVIARLPDDGATGVAVDALINAMFDEQVTGVFPGAVTVLSGSTLILGAVSYTPFDLTATFDPTDQLAPHALYTVGLSASITDFSGNPVIVDTWSFTTGDDTVAPSITDTIPFPGQFNVATSSPIIITFDEPVQNVTTTTFTLDSGGAPIAGTISPSNGGATQTFTPAAILPAATTFTVTLGTGITDLTGNPLAAAAGFQFTTS